MTSVLHSRSTIVSAMCFVTLMIVNFMTLKAGFFSEAIALVSIYLCRDLLLTLLKHQETSDELNASTTTTVKSPAAVETKTTSTTETK